MNERFISYQFLLKNTLSPFAMKTAPAPLSTITTTVAVMTLMFSLAGRSSTRIRSSFGTVHAFSPTSNHLATIGLNALQIYSVKGNSSSGIDHHRQRSCRTFCSTSPNNSIYTSSGSKLSGTTLHSSSQSSSASNASSLSSSTTTTTTTAPLPETHPYLSEIKPALSAIRKACRITTYLQPTTAKNNISGLNKKDASPVTIGDFAVQALVLNLLEKEFKKDHNVFVAEEGSKNLVQENDNENEDLSIEILQVMKKCGYDNIISNVEELKHSIDLGQTYQQNGEFYDHILDSQKENSNGPLRTWCLDPIDGTRGFLRGKREGGQYCIALALIEVNEIVDKLFVCELELVL